MSIESRISIITFLIAILLGCSNEAQHVRRSPEDGPQGYVQAININTATLDELQRIPHVGEKVAARIIEHRETNGPFRRVEHLMLIQGISDKRFRKIRPLVRVE